MNTKLTLRLDDRLIKKAKQEAANRGKSVSQMVAEYFASLETVPGDEAAAYPPMTSALLGALRGKTADVSKHKRYLREKYR